MIGIIDYGVGNLASVGNALTKLDIAHEVSDDPQRLRQTAALIFPGVGAAGYAMQQLKERKLDLCIQDAAKIGTPILAICLGMQLLLSRSEEGNVPCLDLIPGTVKKFHTDLKVPQIGWNQVQYQKLKIKNIFENVPDNSYFYFVHSYYCEPDDASVIVGTTDYGGEFCSVLIKDSIIGVQFHPEKSGEAGLQFLKNFCDYASLRGISTPKQSRDSNGIATAPIAIGTSR